MSRTVNIHEAKTHLSRLIEDVRRGEEIVLAKNGRPVARLGPLETPPPKRPLGFVSGHVPETFFDPLPADELELWEGGPTAR